MAVYQKGEAFPLHFCYHSLNKWYAVGKLGSATAQALWAGLEGLPRREQWKRLPEIFEATKAGLFQPTSRLALLVVRRARHSGPQTASTLLLKKQLLAKGLVRE